MELPKEKLTQCSARLEALSDDIFFITMTKFIIFIATPVLYLLPNKLDRYLS